MKRLVLLAMIFVSTTAWALTPQGQVVVQRLESKPLPGLKMGIIQQWQTANGWHILLLEDHTLPYLSAQMLVRSGTVFSSPAHKGVAGAMVQLLRYGGTTAATPAQLDDQLDAAAVDLDTHMGDESAKITVATLTKTRDEAFRYFFDVIFKPRFDPSRFTVIQQRMLDEIRRQNEIPAQIAPREFRSWLYTPNNPWGTTPTQQSVSHLTLADIHSFYKNHFRHGEKWLAVAGDITRPELQVILNKAADLDQMPAAAEVVPAIGPLPPLAVRIVQKKTTQTAIQMGHLGTDRFNPDRFALLLMADILGGSSFTNRLMKTIRTERGLAYETWASYGFGPKQAPGLFTAFAKTQAANTAEVIKLMQEQIRKMHQGEDLTEAELHTSKQAILSGILFEFGEPFSAVTQTARIDFVGYPRNYMQQFRSNIMKVTLADIKRVAKQYLHPDQLYVLVVGDAKTLMPTLAPLGRVEVVNPNQ